MLLDAQHHAEQVVLVRRQRVGPTKGLQRFLEPLQVLQRVASVGQDRGVVRVELQGPAHQFGRSQGVAGLRRNNAQQVQRIDVPRLDLQHLPVQRARLRQLASLMQRQAPGEEGGSRHRRRGLSARRSSRVHACR